MAEPTVATEPLRRTSHAEVHRAGLGTALRLTDPALTEPAEAERIATASQALRGAQLAGVCEVRDLGMVDSGFWLISAGPATPTLSELIESDALLSMQGAASVLSDIGFAVLGLHGLGWTLLEIPADCIVIDAMGRAWLLDAPVHMVRTAVSQRAAIAFAALTDRVAGRWVPDGSFAPVSAAAHAEGMSAALSRLLQMAAGQATTPDARLAVRAAMSPLAATVLPTAAAASTDAAPADAASAAAAAAEAVSLAETRAALETSSLADATVSPETPPPADVASRAEIAQPSATLPASAAATLDTAEVPKVTDLPAVAELSEVTTDLPKVLDEPDATQRPLEATRPPLEATRLPATAPAAETARPPAARGESTVLREPPGNGTAGRPVATVLRFGPGVPTMLAAPAPVTIPAADGNRTTKKKRRGIGTIVLLAIIGVLLWWLLRPVPTLRVSSVSSAGPTTTLGCNSVADLHATVRTNGVAGTLHYHWLRSDGASSGPLVKRLVKGQRDTVLHLLWTVRGPGEYHGAATLLLDKPAGAGATTSFSYAC